MGKKEKRGKIAIDRERCKGCYLCQSVCPNQVIHISKQLNQQGYYPIEFKEDEAKGKKCKACALCAVTCPDIAIEVYRE